MRLFDCVGEGELTGDLMAPVQGVTLQKYAELAVKMRGVAGDRDACARIAEREGVSRAAWEKALVEWNVRLGSDVATGAITMTYYKHYKDALARFGAPVASATFDAYVEMSAMIRSEVDGSGARPTDVASMCAVFGITEQKWVEISRYWTTKLMHEPQLFATYSERVRARVKELDEQFARTSGV